MPTLPSQLFDVISELERFNQIFIDNSSNFDPADVEAAIARLPAPVAQFVEQIVANPNPISALIDQLRYLHSNTATTPAATTEATPLATSLPFELPNQLGSFEQVRDAVEGIFGTLPELPDTTPVVQVTDPVSSSQLIELVEQATSPLPLEHPLADQLLDLLHTTPPQNIVEVLQASAAFIASLPEIIASLPAEISEQIGSIDGAAELIDGLVNLIQDLPQTNPDLIQFGYLENPSQLAEFFEQAIGTPPVDHPLIEQLLDLAESSGPQDLRDLLDGDFPGFGDQAVTTLDTVGTLNVADLQFNILGS